MAGKMGVCLDLFSSSVSLLFPSFLRIFRIPRCTTSA